MAHVIDHDYDGCIGCGSCAALCEENWEMDDDNKAVPKKTKLEETEFESNKEAADCCPVNVIHIVDTETGERII